MQPRFFVADGRLAANFALQCQCIFRHRGAWLPGRTLVLRPMLRMPAFTTFGLSLRCAILGALTALAAPQAAAQDDAAPFAAEASRFLQTEWPKVNAAVAAKDRSYFEGAMARTVELAERWSFKSRPNPQLAAYSACTDAVSDMVVVGLCQLTPSASECTPNLAADFERKQAACHALSKR